MGSAARELTATISLLDLVAVWGALAALSVLVVVPLCRAAAGMGVITRSIAAGVIGVPPTAAPIESGDPYAATEAEGVAPSPQPQVPAAWEVGYPAIVLERLARHACTLLGVEESRIFVRDRRDPTAVLLVAGGGIEPDAIGERLPIEGTLAGAVMGSGQPLFARDDGSAGLLELAVPSHAATAVAVPVPIRGRVEGALQVAAVRATHGLGRSDLGLLGEIAALVGRALEHRERGELAVSDPRAEVEGLLHTLQRVDADTRSHLGRVAQTAGWLAELLALPGPDRLELELAALLHDVGKLRVPRQILDKEGPLDASEWEIVRRHPVWGAEIVGNVPGLEAVALIVRHHHERYDGCGYPDGLSAGRIPLGSRIIALADAFAAMTCDRPYRRALARDAALREVQAGAWVQFDPDLTGAFPIAIGDELAQRAFTAAAPA